MPNSEGMKLKALVYLTLFLAGSTLRAETKYIVVDASPTKNSNFYAMYNEVRKGYEVLSSTNNDVRVLAKDGKWRVSPELANSPPLSNLKLTEPARRSADPNTQPIPEYPPISRPAKSAQDIVDQIKSMNLKSGQSVVLYINGHGTPSTTKSPDRTGITFWGNESSWSEVEKALKQISPDIRIKIATLTCFGGGVHSLSRNLPNVCSTSTVPFFSAGSAGNYEEHQFNKGFWQKIQDTKGRTSFAEASIEGFKTDTGNFQLGSLSSFDYIDFVMKKSPYDKERPDIDGVWINQNGKKIWQKKPPSGFERSFSPEMDIFNTVSIPSNLESKVYLGCSGGVQSDLAKLTQLSQTLNEVARQAVVQDIHKKAERQPAQVRTIFHDVIDDMKKNGSKYLQIAKMYEDKFKDLARRWNVHKEKNKDSWGITKWWYGEGDERAKIQKEFDALKANAQQDLKQYSFNHQMLERLGRLDEFNKKATPEQKEKFVHLLQCEWEPL